MLHVSFSAVPRLTGTGSIKPDSEKSRKKNKNKSSNCMGFVEGLGSNQKNANIVTGIPGLDTEK